jgi:hypothetical protein
MMALVHIVNGKKNMQRMKTIMTRPYFETEKLRDENISRELEPIYAKANCKGKDGALFFPSQGKGMPSVQPGKPLHEAFTICNECVVKEECFNFALAHECVGVWGGRYFSLIGLSNVKIKENAI